MNDSGMSSEQVDNESQLKHPNQDSFLSRDSLAESFQDASFVSADRSGFPAQDSFVSEDWHSQRDQSQSRRAQPAVSAPEDSFRGDPFAPVA